MTFTTLAYKYATGTGRSTKFIKIILQVEISSDLAAREPALTVDTARRTLVGTLDIFEKSGRYRRQVGTAALKKLCQLLKKIKSSSAGLSDHVRRAGLAAGPAAVLPGLAAIIWQFR